MKTGTTTRWTNPRTANTTSSWIRGAQRLAAVALLSITTLSFADTRVPDCAPGTLSDYQKLGAAGCMIGDKKFSNFHYQQGTSGLPSDAISVTPGTTPETNDPGILFEGKWASTQQESFVSYTVEATPNGKPITGASLEMQFGQITGNGKAQVVARLCPAGGLDASSKPQKLQLQVVLSPDKSKKSMDQGQFKDPQQQVRVTTPVDVSTGRGGTAELDGFMTVFR